MKPESRQSSEPRGAQNVASRLADKLAALLEVMGILIVGSVAAGHLGSCLGLKPIGSLLQSAAGGDHTDFIALSTDWLQSICVLYACLLLPAFALGWWRRRLTPRNYGITTGKLPVVQLIALGLLCFSLVALPGRLLWFEMPVRQILAGQNWAPSFWLFHAVASLAVTPALEELFYRGYCQTRLEENFGGFGAVVIVTLFMALGHNQYHQLNAVSIGMIVAGLPMALGMSYLYWHTRSLVPGFILHAALNVPTKGIYDYLLPAAMMIVVILFRKRLWSTIQSIRQLAANSALTGTILIGVLPSVALFIGFEIWPAPFGWLAFVGLGIALLIEYRQRRSTAAGPLAQTFRS